MKSDLSIARKITPWVLGVILMVLAFSVMLLMGTGQADMAAHIAKDAEDDVRERVESWEQDLITKLTQWAEIAATNSYQATDYQAHLRETAPWFDSLYIWEPATQVTNQSRTINVNGRLRFPESPLVESADAIRQIDCLTRARMFASQPDTSVDGAVLAWRNWCKRHDASIRMLALSEGINILRRNQRWEDIVEVLAMDGLPPRMTLDDATRAGIPPYRAAILSIQNAEALWNLGRDDEAAALDFRTGMEITQLDAPDAEVLLQLLAYPLVPRVEARNNLQRTRLLGASRNRSIRRVNGYHEVRDNLLPRRVPLVPEAPRFIRDQYGDAPFLLFTHWARNGNIGVAIQLDQAELIDDLLAHMGRYRRHIVITEESGGRPLAGARRGGAIVGEVNIARTLTHLRIGIRSNPVDLRLERMNGVWNVLYSMVGMMIVVAIVALFIIVRTNRTQRLLLVRQKEFATRVTHELKTPLAGIKVMAENLELGHYADDEGRASMARSIVREADNLTARVNEILSVTRERTLRSPEPFDPEEPLFEAIDQWGPRMEVAGVRFEADLHPTDEVLGDAEAFRDAVACLLDNALKYRRPDAEPSIVRLLTEQEGTRIRVIVEDNGLGVPKKMRSSIFDRFVRVEGDNRGKSGGHGLGLAQVAQIVEGHGGKVTCTDGIDGGSRFVIDVPALA